MSFIDDTFAAVPGPLLRSWGQDLVYIKTTGTETYSPSTGNVTSTETSITIRAVITKVNPQEFDGSYQTTDLKIIFGNEELGDYIPTIRDRIQYQDAGTTKVARIIDVNSYRGERPVLHILIARPQ